MSSNVFQNRGLYKKKTDLTAFKIISISGDVATTRPYKKNESGKFIEVINEDKDVKLSELSINEYDRIDYHGDVISGLDETKTNKGYVAKNQDGTYTVACLNSENIFAIGESYRESAHGSTYELKNVTEENEKYLFEFGGLKTIDSSVLKDLGKLCKFSLVPKVKKGGSRRPLRKTKKKKYSRKSVNNKTHKKGNKKTRNKRNK